MIRLIDKYVQAMQGLRPLHCHLFGLDDLAAGTIISGGLGALGSIVGAFGSNKAQKSANEQNLQIARENNATSLRIAQENNALQQNMQQANNEFNQREAEKTRAFAQDMFNQENRYNSPIEQLKRYQMAGLNPAVAMTDAQAMAASGTVPSGASASPSGISPSMPILTSPQMSPVPSVASSILDNLGKVADVAVKVSQAEKTGADTHLLKSAMDDMISKWHSDSLSAEANAKYQQISTELYKKYGDIKWNKEMLKLDGEINDIIAHINVNRWTADEINQRIEKLIYDTHLSKAQWEYAKEKAARAKEFVNEELNAIKSGAEAAVKQAMAAIENAHANSVSAHAAHMNAETNDYLAHHPQDFGTFIVRALQDGGMSTDKVGKFLASFIDQQVAGNASSKANFIKQLVDGGLSSNVFRSMESQLNEAIGKELQRKLRNGEIQFKKK